MSRAVITVDDIAKVMKQIAEAEPDHVDECVAEGLPARYVVKGRPNCLVARVLNRLGFSVSTLRALDREYRTGELVHPGVPVAESGHPALRNIDPLAMQLLKYVQDQQDRGRRWGAIVSAALRRPRLLAVIHRRRKPWLFPD